MAVTTGLVFAGSIEIPRASKLEASDLEAGDLFVLESEINTGLNVSVEAIRCAVSYYDHDDNDVRYVRPFEANKDELDDASDLCYISNSETVRRVEIVASGIKVI